MDHIPTPLDSTRRRFTVPYVSTGSWDRGDFFTYPSRAPGDWSHFLREKRIFFWHETNTPSSDAALASFLQTWLFFGLLYEVLNPWQLYREKDYIDRDEDKVVVHTRHLSDRLEEWRQKCLVLPTPKQKQLEQKLFDLFTMTYTILYCIRLDNPGHSDFDPSIRWSLTVLYDTLVNLGQLSFVADVPWRKAETRHVLNSFCQADIDHMRANGWCLAMINNFATRHISNPVRWYMSCMRQPTINQDHDQCPLKGGLCRYEQALEDKEHEPSHVSGCTGCTVVRPDVTEIEKILRAGSYPVMDLSMEFDQIHIRLKEYEPGTTHYVALSHVWAEGLGNANELALPSCQLRRLRDFVAAIDDCALQEAAGTPVKSGRRLYVWLDTLLVPHDPPAETSEDSQQADRTSSNSIRQLAMSRMRDIYVNSTYTLVLSNALVATEAKPLDNIELATRVLTNNWHQRLWTLQEAALPQTVLYQFADGIVSNRQINQTVRDKRLESTCLRTLCVELNLMFIQLRLYNVRSLNPGLVANEEQIQMLASMIGSRRCTLSSDEPLCAGALLGLDIGALFGAPDIESRMISFWQQYGQSTMHLPQNIIFHTLPRLKTAGMQWAPATLRSQAPLCTTVGYTQDRNAEVTTSGLRVVMPAWRISFAVQPLSSPKQYAQLLNPLELRMSLRGMRDGSPEWYDITLTNADPGESWNDIFAVRFYNWRILIENDVFVSEDNQRQGLLGVVTQNDAGETVVVTGGTVAVSKLSQDKAELREASWQVARYLRQCRQYRNYLMCWLIVMGLEHFFLRRPWLRHSVSLRWWFLFYIVLGRHHSRYFIAEIMRLHNLPVSPRLAALVQAEGPRQTSAIIHAQANHMFHGKFAHIEEAFDSSSMWIVD